MKKLLSILLTLLMLAIGVSAYGFPHPIHGHITQTGIAVYGLEIRVENLDTGAKEAYKTDSQGFYIVDLGNIDERYRDGDSIKVSLLYCESLPQCSAVVKVSGGENKLDFDVASIVAVAPLPAEVIIVNYICPDGAVVKDKSLCPLPPVPTPTPAPTPVLAPEPTVIEKVVEKKVDVVKIFCEDGTQVIDSSQCQSDVSSVWGYIIEALAVVLVGFGWSKGFLGLAKYYWKKGEEAEKAKDKVTALKYKSRAITMAKTAFAKALAKDYEKIVGKK